MVVLSFSIVVVLGIMTGNSIPFVIKKGAIATLITGILWGLIGYLAFDDETKEEEVPEPQAPREDETETGDLDEE